MKDFIKDGLTWLDVELVRNEIQHIINAPDPELYTDRAGMKYYLHIDLPEFYMSGKYETMIRLEGREKPPVTIAGASVYEGCSFRLEELLAGQMSISLPLRDNTLLSTIATLTTRYRVREIIEPDILDNYLPAKTAMRAGIAMRDFVGYQHSFFSRYQSKNRQFLTWQPKEKLVSVKQREYLYFLLNMEPMPTEVRLRLRITRKDGTRSVSTAETLNGLGAFQVVCCQVSPQALGITEDVEHYEVWLSDQEDLRLTEVRKFVLDRRPQAFERFIIFSNSFGGFDTIRLTGSASEETDVVKNTSRKERQAGSGLDFSELEIISVNESSGIQLTTGFFEQNEAAYLDYLRELMLAEVVLLDTEYGFEAVTLMTNNLEYAKDRPGLVEKTFTLKRTYSDRNYSRMPVVEPVPARPTRWIGISSTAMLDAFGKRTGFLTYERLQKVYADNGKKVIPYVIKPNMAGTPDYIPPKRHNSITPGSTPYPSKLISRPSTFTRNNCGVNQMGTAPIITVAAAMYGGELPDEAQERAEAKWKTMNTQAYANANGACELNATPIHVAIFHKIPMIGGPGEPITVVGDGRFGPVVKLLINDTVAVTNTIGSTPPVIRQSDGTYPTGKSEIVVEVQYANAPFYPFKFRITSKGIEQTVTGPGFFIFENVQFNSADEPLTLEVINL